MRRTCGTHVPQHWPPCRSGLGHTVWKQAAVPTARRGLAGRGRRGDVRPMDFGDLYFYNWSTQVWARGEHGKGHLV